MTNARQEDEVGKSPLDAAPSARVAADRLLREHGDVLWRFLLARTRSAEVAEDLMQETMLAAMQNAGQFAGSSAERSWLLGIAVHKVADHFRQKQRRPLGDQALDQGDYRTVEAQFSAKGFWVTGPRPWGERPDDRLQHAELLDTLRRCLEKLPPELARVVWLRDLLEMPSADVCKILELTPTNLWTRAYRARAALRLCVEKAFDADEGQAR